MLTDESVCSTFVGQAILPAAAFQAALSDDAPIIAPSQRRLKAGGSQDWLPHELLPTRSIAHPRGNLPPVTQ